MNRKGQPSNSKNNSSKRSSPTNAHTAGSRAGNSASPNDSDKTNNASTAAAATAAQSSKPASFSAAAKQGGRRQTPDNVSGESNGSPAVSARSNSGVQRPNSRGAPVRLPTRNSVSSATAPAIQFGSLNQQTRPASPQAPAAHKTSATSGGVPATSGKPTSKPNFGSIPNSGHGNTDDAGRRQGNGSGSVSGHHGRQQHNHHQRTASRSSGHGRQSQGYGSGRKDGGGPKHGGGSKSAPKTHDAGTATATTPASVGAGEVPFYPPPEAGGFPGSQQAAMQMPGAPAAHHPGGISAQPQQHYAAGPYRGQAPQHVRPPHNQSPGGPYKSQAGAHYPPHHMAAQSMGYPMPAPGQAPMQPPIITSQPNMPPMQGWMPPTHQFAYMPMGAPGYEQYYRPPQSAGGPPPHNMYGVHGYSMPNPTHASVPSQMGAGGIMPGSMGSAQMPGMTASPMPGQQQPMPPQQQPPHHGLSASAQTFVPGRRAVRIVNPNTNEEVDVSQQRLRSGSAASSTPQNVASGTASPAPGVTGERQELAPTPEIPVVEETPKPTFKIPSARAIKIVNPKLASNGAESDSDKRSDAGALAKPAATEAVQAAPATKDDTPAAETKDTGAAEKDDSGPMPMEIDEKEKPAAEPSPAAETKPAEEAKPVAETKPVEEAKPSAKAPVEEEAKPAESAAQPAEEKQEKPPAPEEKPSPPKEEAPAAEEKPISVDDLADSLAKTSIAEETKPEAEEPSAPEPAPVAAEPAAAEAKPSETKPAEAKPVKEEESAPAPAAETKPVEEEEPKEAKKAEDKAADTEPASQPEEESKEPAEDGEIDEDKESAQPPSMAQSRSRQVTFSEPPTPSVRTLETDEIVELYSGTSNAPSIVDEILRYPRVFLERFDGLCTAPPTFHFEITSTDDRWAERGSGMRRSGSGRHRDSPASGFGGMGNFRTNNTHSSFTSEDRFGRGSMDLKGRMDGGRGSMMGGRSTSGQYRGPGGGRESRGGRSGGRGRGRGRGGRGGSHHGDRYPPSPSEPPANVKPLEKGENRYIAKSLRTDKDTAVEDDMDEEVYDRRMRALLNKITPDNFDVVSDELVAWGNKSEKETDGRILRHLIMLVFQKATDEPVWAKLYAQLCLKVICCMSDKVEDQSLRTKDGGNLSGRHLARKYLLTKCQEEFERGWKVEIPMDIESSEYYEAIKIKRRGLGLVKFIGELFLFDVLTSRIMHECVKRLLSNYETPEEEETESLAKLLTTVGKKLDNPDVKKMDVPDAKKYMADTKKHMDAYFNRIQTMATNKQLTSRIRFMLKDLIELRQMNWVMRMPDAGPKTIAEIHEDAERAKTNEAVMRRAPSDMGRRSESHRGRGDGPGGRRSGWNTVGGPSGSGRADQNQRAGDLSGFGNMDRSKQQPSATNPFGALAGGSRGWRHGSSDSRKDRNDRARPTGLGAGGRTPSHSSRGADSSAATPEPVGTRNMFDALMNNEEDDSHMSPRAEAAKGAGKVPALSKTAMASATTEAAAKPMDTATIQPRVKGFINEYLQLKMDSELLECFKELGEVNFQNAMYEIINNTMERREDQTAQIAKGVAFLRTKGVLSEDTAVAALAEYSEQLEDMALDAPNAYKFFGMMMAAAEVPLARIPEALGDLATKLTSSKPPALNVVLAYVKQRIAASSEEETRDAIAEAKFDVAVFFNQDRRSEADVKKALSFQDLQSVFPQYA